MNGDIGIGKLIEEERGRDAIHIAVAPVEAAELLRIGSHVCILPDGRAGYGSGTIGIVDPFLAIAPKAGDKFYLFLYPGTITSLRHEWIHPAFKDKDVESAKPQSDKAASEAWLREYARKVNPYYAEGGYYWEKNGGVDESYNILMQDLAGNSITYHGIDMHSRGELIDEADLKRHGEIVLGKPINFGGFEYFSCSC